MRNIIIVFHSFKPSLYFLIVSLLTFVFYQHRLDYIFVCSLHCWSRNRHWEIQFNRQSGFKQAKNVPIRAVKRTEFVLWKHQITLSINYLIYYHKMFGMTFFIVFPGNSEMMMKALFYIFDISWYSYKDICFQRTKLLVLIT